MALVINVLESSTVLLAGLGGTQRQARSQRVTNVFLANTRLLTVPAPALIALRASFPRHLPPIPRAPVSPVPIIPSRSRALITSPGASATRATLGRTDKNALRVPRASSRMLTAAQPQRLRPLPPLLAQETVHVSPPLGCRQGRFRTESVITAILRVVLGSSRRRL